MTFKVIVACAVVGMLIVQGFFRHGTFLAGEWIPYARRFVGGGRVFSNNLAPRQYHATFTSIATINCKA